MISAEDRASSWFTTGASLTHGTKSLAGFIKCWDTMALAKRLHKLLTSILTKIETGCNKALSLKTMVEASGVQDLVELGERDMNLETWGFAEIILIFGILLRADIIFQGKKIFDLTMLISKYEWVGFLRELLLYRYREYNSKVLGQIEDSLLANQARPKKRTLGLYLNLM